VGANRGASGIDGTVASAAGFATGISRPITLLVGDLALLHDLNSLALLEKTPVPVTVVVLNNNGAGIFDFLPVAECKDILEPFFITPHGKTFTEAASMFNLAYDRPDSAESFVTIYQKATEGDRSSLIEVSIDRHYSFDIHQKVHEQVIRGLSE